MTGIAKLSTEVGPNWNGIYVPRKILNHQFNPFNGKIPQIYKVDAHALSWMENTALRSLERGKKIFMNIKYSNLNNRVSVLIRFRIASYPWLFAT